MLQSFLYLHLGFYKVNSIYVVGSKSFRPDIQNPRQMKIAVRDIQCRYSEVNVSVEKCVEIKGGYVEK